MKNKEINVFIASPGDVKEEREIIRETCEELNKSTLLKPFSIYFQATGWEDAFPSPGRPQQIINKLLDGCNIFVCIFHKRFGIHTGKVESGTLEEFLLAYDSWKSLETPHIMFYFKEVRISSKTDFEDKQLQKVFDLKEKIDKEKLLLFSEFSTPEEFREKIKDHLEQWTIKNSKNWERIGDKIEKAFEEEKIFKNYLQAALNEHRHLQTQGFETTLRVPIELEKVYINMKAQIHTHDAEFTLRSKEKIENRNREESLSSLDIKAAFETSEQLKVKDIVILGDPGSGKTTLLKYILVLLIEGKGSERLGITEKLIPFFASLRELQDPEKVKFADFISKSCDFDDYLISIDSFNKLLDEGRGIILLDGLDEVANEEMRVETCGWIDRAIKRYPNTSFVITSRYAGYLGKSRLKGSVLELSVQDFTMDEVREFLINWFMAVEVGLHPGKDEAKWGKKGKEDALLLAERITKSEHITKLAVNPLLLQIIALVHRDRGTLPQRRVELYEECTNVLLEKWDMAKGLDVLLSAREARQVLQPLALWLHDKDERRSAPLKEIKEVIKEPLDKIGKSDIDPEMLLKNIRDRSGIFMGYSEIEYGFTHLSFQEYLSAEQIRNKSLTKVLLENYGERWWREVILLSLALNNPSIIEEFMEQLIPTEKFLSEISIIEDAVQDSIEKPTGPFINSLNNEKIQPEAKYNAIRILGKIGGDKAIQTLKETIDGSNKKLARSAYEALDSLNQTVGITRPVDDLPAIYGNSIDDSKMVLVPAGTFLYGSREDDNDAHSNEKPQRVINLSAFYMDEYPVTNEQFCKFLNSEKPNMETLEKWINLEGGFQKEKCRIKRDRKKYIVEKGFNRHPVIYVSWYGAVEYARWAGKRLPTEQEWEKAARGTDGRIYPWGDTFDSILCNSSESGIGMTTTVGKFHEGKSCYGCYDMAGNVWEWTNSHYDDNKKFSVLRGGSWNFDRLTCRCAYRNSFGPLIRFNDTGFRCARTLTL